MFYCLLRVKTRVWAYKSQIIGGLGLQNLEKPGSGLIKLRKIWIWALAPNKTPGSGPVSSPAGDGPGPATGGKEQEPLVLPSPIRVGSLCSGMKTEHWSLDLLRWDFEEVFWCEPDETARKFVEANMSSKVRGFRDLMGREFQGNAPPCDLLVAGFPCQPFSIQGKGHGLED